MKGGGHSYLGTSNAPDSLLVWTRRLDSIAVHDAFVPAGGQGRITPCKAVSVGAGAIWGRVYHAVAVEAGRYVQGGGCLTVGVAGLIQSGGFGSFSKTFGSAAASLIEAEVVTSDGKIRTVNAVQEPELFWALKGGGGGSFGIVTRLTLKTHDLPRTIGAVNFVVKAQSDVAFQRLVTRTIDLYAERLFNEHWGEQIILGGGNRLQIAMTCQNVEKTEIDALWAPLLDWIRANPNDYAIDGDPLLAALPARKFWDMEFLSTIPGVVMADDRPGAPAANMFWTGNKGEAGQVLHGYASRWLPAGLLQPGERARLIRQLVAASRHWRISLHCNKGLAGAPAAAIAASRDTATNPAMLDAFALLICASEGPPAYPGVAGHEPDVATARDEAAHIARAMTEIAPLAPDGGSYVSESDYFEKDWRTAYWGPNHARLHAIKQHYDPDGLFIVHHGVGSDAWSADGFTHAPPPGA